ncbi:hypothetical protein NL676_039109 [Syzygium grande]|nr:hypothetical protein NL676_039109 [Syzygium grande]
MTWWCSRPRSTQETQRIIGTRRRQYGSRPGSSSTRLARIQQIDAGKQSIMRRTELSAHDLRILDPFLSYPSSITGRERAIVIKLEHIKGIITAHNVLLLNYRNPAVVPFVEELKRRFSHYHEAKAAKTKALEEEAYPALDKLTSVRDELEHLLQDDGDMAGMYLTSKLLQEEDDNSSSSSAAVEEEEVHELNNDGHIMNLMLSLREYVDDTEDYVNIMLDDKQNNLLQMGVLMTTAILVISLYIVVAGVMGMNITITLWHPPNQSHEDFVWTNGACTIMTILLYVGIVAWYKYKGLLY